jgi:hypothetical protein
MAVITLSVSSIFDVRFDGGDPKLLLAFLAFFSLSWRVRDFDFGDDS